MVDVEKVLRDKIKPELNFLYTEEPAWREGGNDWGWFCREHAYHTYFLCRMLGVDTQIILGHTSLCEAGGEVVLSSFGEDCDHAWLNVGGVCPVDPSFTLEYFDVELPSIDLVYGPGPLGDYYVTYERGPTPAQQAATPGFHHIRYMELDVISVTPESLLEDPFIFLKPAKRGGLAAQFGYDIFDRITYHLFRVANGEIGGYREYVKPWNKAIERIKRKNPDGARRVRDLLQRSRPPCGPSAESGCGG